MFLNPFKDKAFIIGIGINYYSRSRYLLSTFLIKSFLVFLNPLSRNTDPISASSASP